LKGDEKKKPGGKNGIQLTDAEIAVFKKHFESFPTEIGASSCNHMRSRHVIMPIPLSLLNGIAGCNTKTTDSDKKSATTTLTIPTWDNMFNLYVRHCENEGVRSNYRAGY
jgi:hypothetical protein